MTRGHLGYWLVFAVFAAMALGLLYLWGIDDPARKPWAVLAVLVGVAGAEVVAAGLIGWRPVEQRETTGEAGRASVALRGVAVGLVTLVGSLILYGITDSSLAAWVAAVSLMATLLSGLAAQLLARGL